MYRPSCILTVIATALTCLGQTVTPSQPEQVCLSEIVFRTHESSDATNVSGARHTAREVRRAIQLGGSFADLARANSEEPSALQGGRIGCFKRGQLEKQIEQQVFKMKVGDTTNVIQTKVGFVLLRVTGHIDNSVPSRVKPSLSSEQPSGLQGQVLDKFEHAPIGDVYVLVHSSMGPDLHIRTDGSGKYSIELPPGVYDVLLSADGFSPTSRKIEVIPSRMSDFDAVLEFNDLDMQQERADR